MTLLKDFKNNDIQTVQLGLKLSNSKPLVIMNHYREWCGNHYQNQSDNLCKFISQLRIGSEKDKPVIAVGDFNLDLTRSEDHTYQHRRLASNLISEAQNLGLCYIHPGATFSQERNGQTISSSLDYILTNRKDDIGDVKTKETSLSDHKLVMCDINMSYQTHQSQRTFRKPIKDITSFKLDLSLQPWEQLINYADPNKQLELFYLIYNKVLDKHSPVVTKLSRKNKKCPLSKKTKDAMKSRDKLKQS